MAFITEKEMAEALADKTSNLNKGSHPPDVADGKANEMRIGAETVGMEGADWGKTDEEKDEEYELGNVAELHTRNKPLSNSETRKRKSSRSVSPESQKRTVLNTGGGLGFVDLLQEDSDNLDPEMRRLVQDYNSRPKEDGRSFQDWLDGDDFVPSTTKPEKSNFFGSEKRHFKPGGVPIDLSTQAAQHDTAVSLAFEDLDPVWGDEKTVAHYVFGEKGRPDVIAFTNSELVGTRKGGAVAIEVSKFNEVLEASDIKMRLRRPKHGDPTNVQKVLSNLRLGKKGSRYGGEKTRIIYPEKPKEDKKKPEATKTKVEALQPMEGKFNIYINGKELDRLTKDVHGPGADEAQKNRDSVNDFAYYLSSEQENVESLMFLTDSVDGSEPTKIKAVVLQVLDIPKGGTREDAERKSIVIPIHIFNRVFNSTEPYHKFNKQENEVVGVKFRTKLGSGGGWEGFIHPKTNDENLQKVIDKMRFEGKSLSSDIKVSIGPRKEYSPQVAETPVAEAA